MNDVFIRLFLTDVVICLLSFFIAIGCCLAGKDDLEEIFQCIFLWSGLSVLLSASAIIINIIWLKW